MDWIKSPQAYFVTAEELAKWHRDVAAPEDAQKFIDEYFRVRGEQFKKELNTRIEFADGKFSIAKVPGSRTAMGRAFIILGAPNEQKTNRGGVTSATTASVPEAPRTRGGAPPATGSTGLNNRMQDSAIERGSKVTYTWVYRTERLPAELGRSELTIDFNTDVSRGAQFIENPGLVEPYLRRAAAHFSTKYASASTIASANRSAEVVRSTKPSAGTPDPLWHLTPSLNGAIYTADAFVSPREAPFYAVSFFLPKEAEPFQEWKSGLIVSLVKDAFGDEVVAERQQVEFQSYDADGNRYVDRAFALRPGKYEGMFALFSPDGTTMLASHREAFEVSAATAPRVSKLLLTSHVDTLETQDPLDPFTFVAQKYAVRGDRRFRSSDRISLFTIVANPTGSPSPRLMQQMTFSRDGRTIAKMPLEPAQLTQTGPNTFLVGAAFDPNSFKPGHYTVELLVRDFNAPEGSALRTTGYVRTAEFDVR